MEESVIEQRIQDWNLPEKRNRWDDEVREAMEKRNLEEDLWEVGEFWY